MFNHCTVRATWWKRFQHQHHPSSKLTSTIDQPNFHYRMRLSQRNASTIAAMITRRLRSNHQMITGISAFDILTLGFNGRGEKTIPRGIFSFAAVLAGTSPRFFKRLYRMSHPSFMILADKIAFFDDCKFRKSSPLQRLSVTLRWLAGGSYFDIALAHNISTSNVYYYIDETMRAIDGSLDLTFPYRDGTWLKEVSEGFSRAGRSALDICGGALDGIAVKITEPAVLEVANSSSYYNRKG